MIIPGRVSSSLGDPPLLSSFLPPRKLLTPSILGFLEAMLVPLCTRIATPFSLAPAS